MIEETFVQKNVLHNSRRVGIVLQPPEGKLKIWMGVKSRNGANLRTQPWRLDREEKSEALHREFAMDCAANTDVEKYPKKTISFEWWMHDFTHRASGHKGPDKKELDKFNKTLHIFPTPRRYQRNFRSWRGKMCGDVKAKTFNVWNIVTSHPVRDILLDGISDAVIDHEAQIGDIL